LDIYFIREKKPYFDQVLVRLYYSERAKTMNDEQRRVLLNLREHHAKLRMGSGDTIFSLKTRKKLTLMYIYRKRN